jgi:hypothetical protein
MDIAIKTAKFGQKQRFHGDKKVLTSDKKAIRAPDPTVVSTIAYLPEDASQ